MFYFKLEWILNKNSNIVSLISKSNLSYFKSYLYCDNVLSWVMPWHLMSVDILLVWCYVLTYFYLSLTWVWLEFISIISISIYYCFVTLTLTFVRFVVSCNPLFHVLINEHEALVMMHILLTANVILLFVSFHTNLTLQVCVMLS